MARRQRTEISEEQFLKATEWLENGGTKKGACEILGVSNNKTMESRIEEWVKEKEVDARMRKEKRKQPCSPQELATIIESYFDGDSLGEMSKRFYRSTAYIKHRLELAGAMIRDNKSKNPLDPPFLPEECILLDPDFRVRESKRFEADNLADFEVKAKATGWPVKECIYVHTKVGKWSKECKVDRKGEVVWLPGYQCLAEVVKEVPSKQGKAYQLYLLDPSRHQYVNIMYWDIGSLRHLEALGANVTSRGTYLNAQTCQEMLNEALKAAKKAKK